MFQQLLIINSKDRSSGIPENYLYNFSKYNPVKVKGYRINKVSIPLTNYTTPAQTFEMFYAYLGTISPITVTLSIPSGIYTPSTLITALQLATDSSLIGAGNVVWTFANNVFTVATTNTFYKIILYWNLNNLPLSEQYESLGVQMGFVQEGTVYVPPMYNDTFSSTFAVNLSGGPNFYISSTYLQLYQSSYFGGQPGNVIQSVPLLANVGNNAVWQNSVETYFRTDSNMSFGSFDIQLIDYYGNIISLNGSNWEFELQIFHDI